MPALNELAPASEADVHPATRPTTLYLLQNVTPTPEGLREALRPRYVQFEGFRIRDITVGDVSGIASWGVIGETRKPTWVDSAARLIGEPPDVSNHTAATAILLPVGGRVFAVCFGAGQATCCWRATASRPPSASTSPCGRSTRPRSRS